MPLLEKEAFRFAEALEDYEHVSVTDIGGTEEHGFWCVVKDHRFDAKYEIASHCNYWDVVSAVEGASVAFGCLFQPEEEAPQLEAGVSPDCLRHFLRRQGRSLRKENRPQTGIIRRVA